VPEVEKFIRTIKERVRSVYNTLPFNPIPSRMMIQLVYNCTFWINSFPNEKGISKLMIPRTIVTGNHINYSKHCKLEFGEYVQTHEEHDNTMITRTTGAIALRPTGNAQGSYIFFSLSSGRTITRNRWTVLPMPNEVITRVKAMASSDMDDWDDEVGSMDDYDALDDTTDHILRTTNNDDDVESHHDKIIADDEISIGEGNNNLHADIPADEDRVIRDMLENDELENVIDQQDDAALNNENQELVENDNDEIIEPDGNVDLEAEMDLRYGTRNNHYDLRPRRPRDYSHLNTTLEYICLT